MKCRHCQLVEMARTRREGEVDVYQCPKCGAVQRMTYPQRLQARAGQAPGTAQKDDGAKHARGAET